MHRGPGTDEVAFTALYDRTYLRVLAYCLRRTDSREDALDAAADVYVVAWRRLDQVPEGDEALPWLFAVGRRVLANQRRGEDRRQRLAGRIGITPTIVGEISEPLAGDEERARLSEALERVAPADRELLLLDAWEQLPMRQLAACLGVSEGAVKVRLHRARQRLAREYDRAQRWRRPPPRLRAAGGMSRD